MESCEANGWDTGNTLSLAIEFLSFKTHWSSGPQYFPLAPSYLPSPVQSVDGPFIFSSWKKEQEPTMLTPVFLRVKARRF
jgi:hypothetical protein